jgi:ferritin-like metal-binding protein YciE
MQQEQIFLVQELFAHYKICAGGMVFLRLGCNQSTILMPTTKKSNRKTTGKSNGRSKSNNNSRGSQGTEESGQESGLRELFLNELKDIYWAEKHLVKSLPKMQKAATSTDLQEAIEDHLNKTKEHVSRVEQVFELLEEKPQAKKCDAMEGLVEEGEGVIEDTDDGSATRDAGIIIAAQKVEHYEIAAYGGLEQLARTLGREDVAEILAQTLAEEKEADELLTEIAESQINTEAAEEAQ